MQTKIIGGGTVQVGPELAVMPTFNSAAVSCRPLEYASLGQALGHYRVSVATGTTVSIAGAGILLSLRWPDPSRFLVLLRISMSALIPSTISTATVVDPAAYIVRGFTVDNSGGTATSFSAGKQKVRANMNASLVNSLQVATTSAIAAGTRTPDAAPFAALSMTMIPDNKTLGSAALWSDLYRTDCFEQHPVVLGCNEGIEIQEVTAGPTTGGIRFYFTLAWAEVASF
jgi:hypothetical protein